MAKMILPISFVAVIALFLGTAILIKAPRTDLQSSMSASRRSQVALSVDGAKLAQNKPVNVTPILNQPAPTINTLALQRASDPGLQKLAEYETACASSFGGMMIFAQLPTSATLAPGDASDMAAALKEYSKLGVKPLVIAEPTGDNGTVDFSNFASGTYNQALQTYFAALKQQGINDAQMGTWVPFPEPNTDSWGKNNAGPANFVAAFNAYAMIFKKYFPAAQLSIMLDNQTYDYQTGDYAYVSLAPYISGINKSYISSFSLQGFPWSPELGADDVAVTDAAVFLSADSAVKTAKSLGVNSIWFNTGTYRAMYANDPAHTVTATAAQRAAILDSVFGQASAAKAAGFNIAINIFAENKSTDEEAIDWSYWSSLADINNPNATALANFASKAHKAGIFLSVFDSKQ